MCREADRFAAVVLMQAEVFSVFAEKSGLDVVALQRMYGRAYSTVELRLAELMQHQPLLTVLYDRKEGRKRAARVGRHLPSRSLQGVGGGADARVQAEKRCHRSDC